MDCPICNNPMVTARATNFGEDYSYCRTCKRELSEIQKEILSRPVAVVTTVFPFKTATAELKDPVTFYPSPRSYITKDPINVVVHDAFYQALSCSKIRLGKKAYSEYVSWLYPNGCPAGTPISYARTPIELDPMAPETSIVIVP